LDEARRRRQEIELRKAFAELEERARSEGEEGLGLLSLRRRPDWDALEDGRDRR
jgi:hypothetical protein